MSPTNAALAEAIFVSTAAIFEALPKRRRQAISYIVRRAIDDGRVRDDDAIRLLISVMDEDDLPPKRHARPHTARVRRR
jgi:hypothetical protein